MDILNNPKIWGWAFPIVALVLILVKGSSALKALLELIKEIANSVNKTTVPKLVLVCVSVVACFYFIGEVKGEPGRYIHDFFEMLLRVVPFSPTNIFSQSVSSQYIGVFRFIHWGSKLDLLYYGLYIAFWASFLIALLRWYTGKSAYKKLKAKRAVFEYEHRDDINIEEWRKRTALFDKTQIKLWVVFLLGLVNYLAISIGIVGLFSLLPTIYFSEKTTAIIYAGIAIVLLLSYTLGVSRGINSELKGFESASLKGEDTELDFQEVNEAAPDINRGIHERIQRDAIFTTIFLIPTAVFLVWWIIDKAAIVMSNFVLSDISTSNGTAYTGFQTNANVFGMLVFLMMCFSVISSMLIVAKRITMLVRQVKDVLFDFDDFSDVLFAAGILLSWFVTGLFSFVGVFCLSFVIHISVATLANFVLPVSIANYFVTSAIIAVPSAIISGILVSHIHSDKRMSGKLTPDDIHRLSLLNGFEEEEEQALRDYYIEIGQLDIGQPDAKAKPN